MSLALLELTRLTNGEVLEQLLSLSDVEAAMRPHRALDGVGSLVRLFAQIDDGLPGVPTGVHVRLRRAASTCLAHMPPENCATLQEPSITCRWLWRDGSLQELPRGALVDNISVWSQQSHSADYVLLELTSFPAPGASSTDDEEGPLYARLHSCLAGHTDRHEPVRGADTHRYMSAGQILLDAAVQREALAAQWLSDDQVSVRLDTGIQGAGERASEMRRNGRLLAVYVGHPVPTYRYPVWQFRSDGQPVDHLAQILAVLRELGPFQRESNGLRRTTGWGEVEWFLSPHVLLEGATPAAALRDNPARVLYAARVEFADDVP